MKKLAERIYLFLEEYAATRPDWDEEFDDDDEKYTSPDASMLRYCADMLKDERIPDRCFSEWGSGGYKPYTSKKGREEHDFLIKEIYKIIKNG